MLGMFSTLEAGTGVFMVSSYHGTGEATFHTMIWANQMEVSDSVLDEKRILYNCKE